MSLEDAKALIQETEGYGVLHIEPVEEGKTNVTGLTFYSEESPSITIISSLESKIQRELTLQNRLKEGIDVEKLNASVVHININQESFEGEKTSKMDSVVKLIFGGAAGYLLFMFIINLSGRHYAICYLDYFRWCFNDGGLYILFYWRVLIIQFLIRSHWSSG